MLYSHKWTPDAYLLAKAYIAEDDKKEEETGAAAGRTGLPRIPLRNPSRKLYVPYHSSCLCFLLVLDKETVLWAGFASQQDYLLDPKTLPFFLITRLILFQE